MAKKVEVIVSAKDQASKTIKGVADKATSSFTELNQATELVSKGMKLVTDTAKTAYAVMKDLAMTADAQVAAELRLQRTLERTNSFTKDAFEGMKDYASALQNVSTYGDEAIMPIMALLNTMGVAGDKIQDATDVTLDLASALRMDLNSAARLVARGMQGDITMFKRYGIEIDKEKRFSRAVKRCCWWC
jgi:hypothetical protein